MGMFPAVAQNWERAMPEAAILTPERSDSQDRYGERTAGIPGRGLKSLELFAGAGGLALGTGLAGFETVAAVERDKWAADTLGENMARGYPLLGRMEVIRDDIRDVDYGRLPRDLDLVTGGPPCQPFSIGGKHRAYDDSRDMFSAFADVIAQLEPRAFIIENVKGLTRASFANYLTYIEHRLSMPGLVRKERESWPEHNKRLEREKSSLGDKRVRYNTFRRLFNAADYGTPQKRERVFIVGFREDQDVRWSFPEPTHCLDVLLHDQWITGEYWDRHKVAKKHRGEPPAGIEKKLECLRDIFFQDWLKPWRTVRDALQGLPAPRTDRRESRSVLNHRLQPGARAYVGHTGSPIDMPSKALKAGDHGVPGGENMMVQPDGSVRYFTVREAARIQGFPDGYIFHGTWSESMRQIGNAVPVMLAQAVAASVAQKLLEADLMVLARRTGAH